MHQSLLVAIRIRAFLETHGLGGATVRFYCSYLPRSMQTAALAASAWAALEGLDEELPVHVLCPIGEFANPFEAEGSPDTGSGSDPQAPPCVLRSSESVSTERASRCWAQEVNHALEEGRKEHGAAAFRARIQLGKDTDCGQAVNCPNHLARSWGHRRDDYARFLRDVVPRWVREADEPGDTAPVLRVIVSHGAFIAAHLFPPLSSAPDSGRFEHLHNTDMVFVRYMSDGAAVESPQLLAAPEPLPSLPAFLDTMRTAAVESLWPDSCALDKGAPWTRCRGWRARRARRGGA